MSEFNKEILPEAILQEKLDELKEYKEAYAARRTQAIRRIVDLDESERRTDQDIGRLMHAINTLKAAEAAATEPTNV